MAQSTFDREVTAIHLAHEIQPGSPLHSIVERARVALGAEVPEVVYTVEGGYVIQGATEAVFLGDDGEVGLTDMFESTLEESAIAVLALLGSAALGGLLGHLAVKAKRAVQAIMGLHKQGKESAAEKAWSKLGAKDRRQVEALLDAQTRQLNRKQESLVEDVLSKADAALLRLAQTGDGLELWLMSPQEKAVARALLRRKLLEKGHANTAQQQVAYYVTPKGVDALRSVDEASPADFREYDTVVAAIEENPDVLGSSSSLRSRYTQMVQAMNRGDADKAMVIMRAVKLDLPESIGTEANRRQYGDTHESVSPQDQARLGGRVVVRQGASRLRKVGAGARSWTVEYIDSGAALGGSTVTQVGLKKAQAMARAKEVGNRLGLEVMVESFGEDFDAGAGHAPIGVQEAYAVFDLAHPPAGTRAKAGFPKYILAGVFGDLETAREAGPIVRKVRGKGAASLREWNRRSDADAKKAYRDLGLNDGPMAGTTSTLPGSPVTEAGIQPRRFKGPAAGSTASEKRSEMRRKKIAQSARNPNALVRASAARAAREDDGEDELTLVEEETLVIFELQDCLAEAIEQADPMQVLLNARFIAVFEATVEEGDYERAELLGAQICEALQLDEYRRMTMGARTKRLRARRTGMTAAVKAGKASRSEVRRGNRANRRQMRTSPSKRLQKKRYRRRTKMRSARVRPLSQAREGLGEAQGDQRAYDAALAEFRRVSQAHQKVVQQYRLRKVSDREFFASRKRLDAAGEKVDAAEAAFVADRDASESGDPAFVFYRGRNVTKATASQAEVLTEIRARTEQEAIKKMERQRKVLYPSTGSGTGAALARGNYSIVVYEDTELEESPLGRVKRFLRGSRYTATKDVTLTRRVKGEVAGPTALKIKKGDEIRVTSNRDGVVSFTHKGTEARMTPKALSSFELIDEGLDEAVRLSSKDPMTMTASAINKERDKLDSALSKLMDQMIAGGRGRERFTEIHTSAKGGDALAKEIVAVSQRQDTLRGEAKARYGPNLIGNLPTGRGFGPRRKANESLSEASGVLGESLDEAKLKPNANYTVVAIKGAKVVAQIAFVLGREVPEAIALLKQDNPGAKVSVEDKGRVVQVEALVDEKSPPGFEGTVKAMKAKGMPAEKAFALAWSMYNKGAKSHRKADGTPKDESLDESAQTFGKLKKGDRFRLANDPSNAVLEKTGPTTYKVVSASDPMARGLKGLTLKKDKPVLPESLDEDTNAHGIGFGERQLLAMYDDEDAATRGTFEEWRSKHFTVDERALAGTINEGLDEALVHGPYQIEIANKMRRGRNVGTEYVVTQRPVGKTSILSRHDDEAAAEAWIAAQVKQGIPVYSADRTTVLAYVKKQTTSVGAAKAAGSRSASQERVGGKLAWIIKESLDEAGRDAYIGAQMVGGSKARPFSSLAVGDKFHFPRDPQETLVKKSKAGGYVDAKGRRFKTGTTTAVIKESLDEAVQGYRTLNDAAVHGEGYAKGRTEVWYMKPGVSRDFGMGLDFLRKGHEGVLPPPTAATLGGTHVRVGRIAEKSRERVFGMMQGERWSPNGEARTLLSSLGLHHTSMGVGDVVKIGTNIYFCDRAGFKKLS